MHFNVAHLSYSSLRPIKLNFSLPLAIPEISKDETQLVLLLSSSSGFSLSTFLSFSFYGFFYIFLDRRRRIKFTFIVEMEKLSIKNERLLKGGQNRCFDARKSFGNVNNFSWNLLISLEMGWSKECLKFDASKDSDLCSRLNCVQVCWWFVMHDFSWMGIDMKLKSEILWFVTSQGSYQIMNQVDQIQPHSKSTFIRPQTFFNHLCCSLNEIEYLENVWMECSMWNRNL